MIKRQSLLRLTALIAIGATVTFIAHSSQAKPNPLHKKPPHMRRIFGKPRPGRRPIPGRPPFGPGRKFPRKHRLFNLVSDLIKQVKEIKSQVDFNKSALKGLNVGMQKRFEALEQEVNVTKQMISAMGATKEKKE